MRDNGFTGPTWKAPDSLLPRVMIAVLSGMTEKPSLYAQWPFAIRAVVIVLSAVLLSAGLLLAWKLSWTVDGGVVFLVNSIRVVLILSGKLFGVWNFLIHLVTGNTAALIFLATTGMMIAVAWLCAVWGFAYIVKSERSERTV